MTEDNDRQEPVDDDLRVMLQARDAAWRAKFDATDDGHPWDVCDHAAAGGQPLWLCAMHPTWIVCRDCVVEHSNVAHPAGARCEVCEVRPVAVSVSEKWPCYGLPMRTAAGTGYRVTERPLTVTYQAAVCDQDECERAAREAINAPPTDPAP